MLQRAHIDHEAIAHLAGDKTVIGGIHLLDRNDFHICGELVFAADVEHLLCLHNPADQRSDQSPSAHDQGKGAELRGLIRNPDQNHGAVGLQQFQIDIQIMGR